MILTILLPPKNNENYHNISEHAITRTSFQVTEAYKPTFADLNSREAEHLIRAVEEEVRTLGHNAVNSCTTHLYYKLLVFACLDTNKTYFKPCKYQTSHSDLFFLGFNFSSSGTWYLETHLNVMSILFTRASNAIW